MSTSATNLDKLHNLSLAKNGVYRVHCMMADDRWAMITKGGGMLPEHVDEILKDIEADSGIPYEHLCRLASVVREIYRARVEGVR